MLTVDQISIALMHFTFRNIFVHLLDTNLFDCLVLLEGLEGRQLVLDNQFHHIMELAIFGIGLVNGTQLPYLYQGSHHIFLPPQSLLLAPD